MNATLVFYTKRLGLVERISREIGKAKLRC